MLLPLSISQMSFFKNIFFVLFIKDVNNFPTLIVINQQKRFNISSSVFFFAMAVVTIFSY